MSIFKKAVNVSGRELAVVLFEMNGEQGMTLPMLSEILGVDGSNVRQMIQTYSMESRSLTPTISKDLRKEGFIGKRGIAPAFLPQATIQAIVKRVGTPEAEAIYNQLWDVASAVHTGDIQAAQSIVGLTPTIAISHLKAALAGWEAAEARADEAIRTKALIGSKREASAMGKASAALGKLKLVTLENEALKDEIGEGANWKTATLANLELNVGLTDQKAGYLLTNLSQAMGIEKRSIPHPKFGTVGTYNISVIKALANLLTESKGK